MMIILKKLFQVKKKKVLINVKKEPNTISKQCSKRFKN